MGRSLNHRIASLTVVVWSFGAAGTAVAQQRQLTIDALFDPQLGVDFDGNAPFGLTWLDDQHYLQPLPEPGASGGRLLKVDAVTGNSEPLFDVAQLKAAVAELPGVTAEDASRLARRPHYLMNASRTALVFELANDLFYYAFDATRARRLTRSPATEDEVSFSPDGSMVAFVRERNLFVVDVDHRREHALTTDGNTTTRNGQLDWVYQEEIYGRNNSRGYWWSPDSTRLAYLQLNDSAVPTYQILDHIPYHLEVEHWEYPKAGDPNPKVQLGIVRSAGGKTTWVNITESIPSDPLVVNVNWTPDSQHVAFQVQNREQTWLELNRSSIATGDVTRLLRETTDAWVEVIGPPTWLEDGSFLWLSEQSGWKHLYHYQADGTLTRQVTDGNWEVRQLHGVDETNGWIYVSGTKRSPIGSDVYRVQLDGSNLARLSEPEGTHSVRINPALTYYLDTWSDITTPPQVRLHASNGAEVRIIDANPVTEATDYRLALPKFVQVTNRDGFVMEALMIKPPDFDATRRYPVYQHVYGGPHTQRVRNAWSHETLYWQLLAQHGIIVWVLDNSTASGKGAVSSWPVYQNFGELELRDFEDGIAWLTQQPYVDASRIGIEGWSYGGFMVNYALTHSQSYAMGIAGGSVTDWRAYDTIYTERYMRMPQHNPDGYRTSSPRFKAGDLYGALLLIHGSMDENVHMQNTLQFAYELQKAGKPFDMMIYPKSRHRLSGPALEKHRRAKMLGFTLEHLRPAGTRPAPTSAPR